MPQQLDPSSILPDDHRGLVISIARQIAWDIARPDLLPVLESFGRSGLTEAAIRFDASRGGAFSTYAWPRIRGAILDGLRALGIRRRSRAQRTDDQDTRPVDALDRALPLEPNTATSVRPGRPSYALVDPGPGPELTLLKRESSRLLREAVDALGEPFRSLITRSYFDDEPLESIAADFGHGRSWASRKRQQALDLLALRLRPHAT